MRNVLGSVILIALSINVWFPLPQAQIHSQRTALAVVIRSAKSSYRINDTVALEIQLKNIGTGPLLVDQWLGWAPGHTALRIVDRSGKDVHTNFIADEVPPPPRESDFVELKPGKSYITEVGDIGTHLVNAPGTYTLFMEYTSPVNADWAHEYLRLPKLTLWSGERGWVTSNRIKIRFTK